MLASTMQFSNYGRYTMMIQGLILESISSTELIGSSRCPSNSCKIRKLNGFLSVQKMLSHPQDPTTCLEIPGTSKTFHAASSSTS